MMGRPTLNFIDKFEADFARVDGMSLRPIEHDGQNTVAVSDAHLLFAGDYHRSGVDLIIEKDGRNLLVRDYFKGEKRASLSSSDGATLSGATVEALTGHTQYAQADGSLSSAQIIGHVTKIAGNATVIRNGVAIVLNLGDNLNKGDVVQAGSNSSLGLTFNDGTVFGLSSNARMVLNEMVYDPNGSSNNSLLTLVQGTISFVAGETAKHGSMKVDTPVATMGIRGTAVLVEIGFEVPGQGGAPPVNFQVLLEPTGVTGSYVLYSKSDPTEVIGTVNQAGQLTSVTGAGDVSQSQAPALSLAAQAIVQQIFQQVFPNYNPNPQSTHPGGGSTPGTPVPGATNPDKLPLSIPFDTPTTIQIPINLPNAPSNAAPTVVPVTVTIVKTIDVTPVVDSNSFAIPNQVKINDGNPTDVIVPYVPGSGKIISVSAPNVPAGVDLAQFLTLDPQTGAVNYDASHFAFLTENQKAVVTIAFDSKAGSDTFHETLTLTINGINDPPVVTAANFLVERGGTTVLSSANISVADPDSTGFTFHVANVSHGSFQTSADGVHWADAATFTSADLNGGHVRFVHDGSLVGATFSITADDGANANHLSSGASGRGGLTANHVPNVTATDGAISELPGMGNSTIDNASGTINFADADLADRPVISAAFASAILTSAPHVTASISSSVAAAIAAAEASLQLTPASSNTNSGSVNWTYTIPDSSFDFLSAGETLNLVYTVTADDGRGGVVTIPLTVAVAGSNDAPTISAGANNTGNVTDDGRGIGTLTTTGSIGFVDPDLNDTHTTSYTLLSSTGSSSVGAFTFTNPTSGSGGAGLVNWSYNLSDSDPILRSLAAGQTISQVYEVKLTDGSGAFVTQNVSISITGANDAPLVSATSGTAAHALDIDSATGTISFTDPDLTDRPTVTAAIASAFVYDADHHDITNSLTSAQLTALHALENSLTLGTSNGRTNVGSVSWTYSTTDDKLEFLGTGETAVLNYTAIVNDGHGGVISSPFSVSLGASNVPPVVTVTSGTVAEAGDPPTDSAHGTIGFTDANLDDRPSVSATLSSAQHLDSSQQEITQLSAAELAAVQSASVQLSLTPKLGNTNQGTVDWSYSVPSHRFDFLGAGEAIVLAYTATVDDGHGGIVNTPFSVTAIGSNDAPTIVAGGSTTNATINVNTASSGLISSGAAAILTAHPSGLIELPHGQDPVYGTLAMQPNDDESSSAIDITSVFGGSVNFFGTPYTSLFINNNGNVTFASSSRTFTPSQITGQTNNPMIAAFWADVDTRGGGNVYYQLDATDGIMTITWDRVGYYNQHADKTNTFQIVLVNEGNGNFDISYRYDHIGWTAGDASGGIGGRDGTAARAGYSAGDGVHFFELPQSGNQAALLTLPGTPGNTNIAGVDGFKVRNGDVAPSLVTASGEIDFSDPDLTDVHTAVSAFAGTGTSLGHLSLTKISDTTGSGTGGKFSWTYTADPVTVQNALAAGNRTEIFNVTVGDGHGGTLVQAVVVNLTAPGNPVVTEHLVADTGSSSSDGLTSNASLAGTGLASTAVHLTIDGVLSTASVTTDGGGHWSFTPALAQGFHTIVANQTSGTGSVGSASVSFVLDTQAPTVTIDNEGGLTSVTSQSITGRVDSADVGTGVTLYDGTTFLGPAAISADGSWSKTVELSGMGLHNIIAKDTDAAGNTGSSSVNYTLIGHHTPDTLVAANFNSTSASVFAWQDNGLYTASVFSLDPSSELRARSPFSIAVADVTDDGIADIVTTDRDSNNISVASGNSLGGFNAPTVYASGGSGPRGLSLADMNGDGVADIVVSNSDSNTVGILLSDDRGGVSPVNTVGTGSRPLLLATGDFNGDGKIDVVTANYDSDNLSLLLGDGHGNLTAATTIGIEGTHPHPRSVTVGDVNKDGNLDIVVANEGNSSVDVLIGDGHGQFQDHNFSTGNATSPTSVTLGDLSGDGLPEIVLASQSSSEIAVLKNLSQGNFDTAKVYASPSAVGVVVGDFNGDGFADVATTQSTNLTNFIAVFTGNGDGTLNTPTSYSTGGTRPLAVAVNHPPQERTLEGTSANDTYFGSGAVDNFVFKSGFGDDIVQNFTHGDKLVFDFDAGFTPSDQSSFATWAAAHLNTATTDTIVNIGDNSIIVKNAHLSANDFIVHH